MPKQAFTPDEINLYLKGKQQHVYHEESVKIAEQMAVHADGRFPAKLIEERRPNEPQQVLDYRKQIYTPRTKPVFSKIFSSLQKIRRSADWNIRYEGEFPRINEEETLEQYCEHDYPVFTSVTNWVFTVLLRKYLIDPNAVVMIFPESFAVPENEYRRPIPYFFPSEHVLEFREDDYAVLRNPVGTTYISGGAVVSGESFFFLTRNSILRYDQVNGKRSFALSLSYNHNMNALSAFKLKGVLIDENENNFLYESRIGAIIPELNEAVREYSDLQAAKVNHIYPERWEYTQNECPTCKGTAQIINPNWSEDCNCPTHFPCTNSSCSNGYVVAGPYAKIMIRPNSAMDGGATVPTPPAGFVEKDVTIVELMEKSLAAHEYAALSAINFEFLAKTPLAESGVAKEVDKDELNNTVHSIAEDIVACMDNLYWLTAMQRYGEIYSVQDIGDMVPKVAVPERFDILTSQHTAEDLKNARDSKLNPVIMSALEVDYAGQRFNADPSVRDRVNLVLSLDPLPNVSEDEKMSMKANKGITDESYIISCNIQDFVRRAIQEDPLFAEKTPEEQRLKMSEYAAVVMASTTPVIDVTDPELDKEDTDEDIIGKIPLAVQQLSLAATRASDAGDTALANTIKAKINQLLGQVVDSVDEDPVNPTGGDQL